MPMPSVTHTYLWLAGAPLTAGMPGAGRSPTRCGFTQRGGGDDRAYDADGGADAECDGEAVADGGRAGAMRATAGDRCEDGEAERAAEQSRGVHERGAESG